MSTLAGAIVRLPYLGFEHVVLVTDENTILHSSKENGMVTEEPAYRWLSHPGARVERVLDWHTLQYAKCAGRSKIGQKWNLFENCEHFISEITTGVKSSPQLQVLVLCVLLAGIVLTVKYAN